jgi:hypothetical protein
MPSSATSPHHLRRVFTENFSVSDIAEPLASFDAATPAAEARRVMDQQRYELAGVRSEGLVVGFLQREELDGGTCADYQRNFSDAVVVPDSTSLPTAVILLSETPRMFVTTFGRVGGICTRSDLLKPSVRMWLFGMVTIIEMNFMQAIETRFPDDEGWRTYLSESRLAKAKTLLAERQRRNQDLGLLDCLQFSDKGQIVLRDETLRAKIGFKSRRRGEDTIKRLEALRNNLAHSQDIVNADWETIVSLTENMDIVLGI